MNDWSLVDLFAGCGGGAMGFQAAGFKVKAAIELDPSAAAAYELNVGVKPIIADIRTVSDSALAKSSSLLPGECTLLFGCPPCQSFTALRLGGAELPIDAERDALPREYVRIARSLRPRHIAFENVPGMAIGRGKDEFNALLEGLREAGYNIVHDVVDAADFGVPQHRKRILVIGSLDAEARMPSPTHSAVGGRGRKIAAHRTVRHAIGHLPELASGDTDMQDPFHRARRHSSLALERLAAIPEGGGRDCLPEHLVLECHKNHDGHHDIYGRMWWDRPSPTLTSGCTNVTRGRFAHPGQDRAITLREAMLLQTFPRRTQLKGTGEQMALQIGNAVPTRLAIAIGNLVLELEKESTRNQRSAA